MSHQVIETYIGLCLGLSLMLKCLFEFGDAGGFGLGFDVCFVLVSLVLVLSLYFLWVVLVCNLVRLSLSRCWGGVPGVEFSWFSSVLSRLFVLVLLLVFSPVSGVLSFCLLSGVFLGFPFFSPGFPRFVP